MKALAAAVLAVALAGPAQAVELPDLGEGLDLAARRDAGPDPGEQGHPGQAWIGVGTGFGTGSVDVQCTPGASDTDCSEGGVFQTYGASFTLARKTALRFRWVQSEERHTSPKPYELALLAGTKLGRAPWYLFLGAARVLHPDNDRPNEARAFAWEIVFAPASDGFSGFELGFQGGYGSEIQYFSLSLGLRFGFLR